MYLILLSLLASGFVHSQRGPLVVFMDCNASVISQTFQFDGPLSTAQNLPQSLRPPRSMREGGVHPPPRVRAVMGNLDGDIEARGTCAAAVLAPLKGFQGDRYGLYLPLTVP